MGGRAGPIGRLVLCSPRPLQWAPTLVGYLRFLTESKAVYDAFESIMAAASHPECEWAGSLSLGPAAPTHCKAQFRAPPTPRRQGTAAAC